MDTLHEDKYTFFISRSVFLRMRNVSNKSCRESLNTHSMLNNVFRKSCPLWNNVEEYCRTGKATDDSMAHAQRILFTYGYRHTLRICNTYRFSTAAMTTRKLLNVTLDIHCLSLLNIHLIHVYLGLSKGPITFRVPQQNRLWNYLHTYVPHAQPSWFFIIWLPE
jgi:hypothetical protein